MEARLSEEAVKAALDTGHQGLNWKPSAPPSGILAGVDIDQLSQHPDIKKIVPLLPTQSLYYAIKQKGYGECLDVLAHLSNDQVTRIVDYEAWQRDTLAPTRAFALLQNFAEISSEQLYSRFSEMDEEYQLALLAGRIRVYEFDDPMAVPEELAENIAAMPCRKVYYEILTDDKVIYEAIEAIIQAAIAHNMRYAYALIAHASYNPPNESEAQALRFRNARLEEDGFVTFEEGLQSFLPIDHLAVFDSWQEKARGIRKGAVTNPEIEQASFIDRVLQKAQADGWEIDDLYIVHQNLLYLANSLAAVARVEVDDLFGINRVLLQAKSLVSLGLEYIGRSDLGLGVEIAKAEHVKTLFRIGLSLFNQKRQQVVDSFVRAKVPGYLAIERAFKQRQWGLLIHTFDSKLLPVLGFEHTEVLKGLFNRVPMASCFADEEKNHVEFVPVDSMQLLNQLQIAVSGILSHIQLAVFAHGEPVEQSIEVMINTATVHALLGREFKAQRLVKVDLDDLTQLSIEISKERFSHLKTRLLEYLKSNVSHWASSQPELRNWELEEAMRVFDDSLKAMLLSQQGGFGLDTFVLR